MTAQHRDGRLCEFRKFCIGTHYVFLFFSKHLLLFVTAKLLDVKNCAGVIKEVCISHDGKRFLHVILPHEERLPTTYYGVPTTEIVRYYKSGHLRYSGLKKFLSEHGVVANRRKSFLSEFHGLFDNSCALKHVSDFYSRLYDYLQKLVIDSRCENVVMVCFETAVFDSFFELCADFLKHVSREWNVRLTLFDAKAEVPLRKRSYDYPFKRCVFHVAFPWRDENKNFDSCCRAMMQECFDSNFSLLIFQMDLVFSFVSRNTDCYAKVITRDGRRVLVETDMNSYDFFKLLNDRGLSRRKCTYRDIGM